jgi:hypothetical protein
MIEVRILNAISKKPPSKTAIPFSSFRMTCFPFLINSIVVHPDQHEPDNIDTENNNHVISPLNFRNYNVEFTQLYNP